MEHPCVRVGKEGPDGGFIFTESGCSSMIEFLSSPLFLSRKHRVWLTAEPDKELAYVDRKDEWVFPLEGVRDREEAREAGSFARFLHALPSSCTALRVGRRVKLVSEEEVSALCSGIGSPLCTVCDLSISSSLVFSSITDVDVAQALIRDAIFNNISLRSLSISYYDVMGVSVIPALPYLIPALSRTPTSIQRLVLHRPENDGELAELFRGLAHNTISLTELEITIRTFNLKTELPVYIYDLATMLSSNTTLKSLSHNLCLIPGKVVRNLFTSLEQNAHLTSLSLLGCQGPDWPSASFVLDCLRVNGTLSSLRLQYTPLDGKITRAIHAQLARNKQRVEEQVAALKAQGSALVRPTTIRLFLCGLPFSGKTTLSKSLVRWNTNASDLVNYLSHVKMPKRTRGIKLSTLEKDGIRVSLWDMAGQQEYHAFHDHMFPSLSNDATPSIFLYVWNPVEIHPSTGKEIRGEHGGCKIKTVDTFESEFRYWLRFITSKTLSSLKFKPKLIVAITRADLAKFNMRSYIHNTFNKCQTDFQEHIQLDMDGVFVINARHPTDTSSLGLHIFDCATSISELRPHVYEACNQARRALIDLVHSKSFPPLVTKQEFFRLCKKHLGLDSIDIQEAVALSLNESGDVIYFKAHELVVIDLEWFCHSFMGDLLYFSNNVSQHRGFFSPQHLEDILESKVNSTSARYRTIFSKVTKSFKIKGEDLVNLLIGLQLACQPDDSSMNSEIFIPASLCTIPRRHVAPQIYLKGDERNVKVFLGRRLKCKDLIRTFLTPGIFTLLQVNLNNTFNRVKPTLEEDVIAFSQGGVRVLVEFCKHEGQDHFIDVLIHSRLDLDKTIGWAQEELLDKIESICAHPRGNQGVELAYEVIRPSSVEQFANVEERLCAAFSLDELCEILRDALEKGGTQPNCLESVFHAWPRPLNDSDRVMDLLGDVQTLKIVKEYREKFMLDVEDVLGINVEEDVCTSTSRPEEKAFSSSVSGIERKWIHDEVCQGIQEVRKDIQEVRKDIREVRKEIAKLVDEVQKQGKTVLPEISQKVQKLLTFSWEGEAGKLPRLFVITKGDDLVRKIVGAMVPGLQNVRLELLCEHRFRPHLVIGQHGISFATLEDGLLKQGLPYITMFLKLVGMAVKVGAQAAGVGHSIPDFGRLQALVIDTPKFSSLPTSYLDLQTAGSSRVNFQASQQWLADVLSKFKCDTRTRIQEVFGLYRVRYNDLHVGWLCEEHMHEVPCTIVEP